MRSNDTSDGAARPTLDLERGLPTTAADVAALRRARARYDAPSAADTAEYLRFLAALPAPSAADLRRRPGPALGPPFTLEREP